MIDFYDILTTL